MLQTAALILAAGKGTRMHSDKPKVLQTVLGEPMLRYVLEAVRPVFDGRVLVVVGHQAGMVEAAFPDASFVHQEQQLGTGHALMQAMPALEGQCERVLVVNGDTPLLSEDVVRHFVEASEGADLAFATIELDDPAAYGRVVRAADGSVRAIVEAKDYDPALYGPEPHEVNAGMYCVRLDLAARLLPRIGNANKSGEYYITDLISLAVAEGCNVQGVQCGRDESLMGVNSPLELSRSEEFLRERVVDGLLRSGVMLHAPALVRISPLATVEPGAEITGPCEIYGRSVVRRGARIDSHCVMRDTVIESGAEIRSFCHFEDAHVGEAALVGPYARLRPGAVLEESSHVGNFVELKKSRLGKGAKANHLTYLGDSEIGAGTNIGAGTITCNYDGANKFKTIIGDDVFVGSDTQLVAPVTVGKGVTIAAGTTVTRDVAENELVLSRVPQVSKQGWKRPVKKK